MSLTLDFTGTAPANYVANEVQPISPSSDNEIYIYPAAGPYFSRNLVITYTNADSGATVLLKNGVDYSPLINFPLLGASINQQIYGAISISNTNLNGTISISYQALGGNWVIGATQIYSYVGQNFFNANTTFPALVANPPITLVDGVTNLYLNTKEAIALAQTLYPSVTLGVEYMPLILNGSNSIGAQKAVHLINAAPGTTGSTPAGAASVDLTNTGTATLIVADGTLDPGMSVNVVARMGETIAPISYTVPVGGSALIVCLL